MSQQTTLQHYRSVLFAPASRADLIAKLPRSAPDAVVIDLEDAVPATTEAKAQARPIAQEEARKLIALPDGPAVFIRINSPHSAFFEDDLGVLFEGLAGVMIPKLENMQDVQKVSHALAQIDLELPIFAGLETAAGVWNALEILQQPAISWAYFGAEDYTTDLGGQRSDDNENIEVLYARSRVALAARLAGVPAFDIVVTRLKDSQAFDKDARQGRALGYSGKLCIHPAQVALTHQHFGATLAEQQRAKRLLEAAEQAAAKGHGAFSFDGQMVDEPMLAKARNLLNFNPSQSNSHP